MSLSFDPEGGTLAWPDSVYGSSAKAVFALEAAKRLKAKRLTLAKLEKMIIDTVNHHRESVGLSNSLTSLKQVQSYNGTPYMWFQELKRVSDNSDALNELITNGGNGLTALYRKLGPSQYQRQKGFWLQSPSLRIRALVAVLTRVQRDIDRVNDARSREQALALTSALEERAAHLERIVGL